MNDLCPAAATPRPLGQHSRSRLGPFGSVRALWFSCVLPCICFSVCTPALSAESTTESARVSPVSDSVWYDDDTGELVPVEVQDQQTDTENRGSRWTAVTSNKSTAATPAPATTTSFPFAQLFGWLMLGGLLVGLVSMLAWVFANSDFDFHHGSVEQSLLEGDRVDRQTRQRMEHLPEALRDTTVNPRSEAERLMREGQFNEAIIYLYGHQLLLLDRVHWLRLARGKTNSRYVREAKRSQPDTGSRLQHTVAAFERAYFGRHELSQSEFERLWQTNAALEQAIQSADSARQPGAA
ncbi:putative signal peptide and transmembrane protein [Rhodopirellula islandica]|uniref:Signal peptide and transmembrane protein n=1 Tax=Rhodopirellula islandica TaxID=595434 RepID=A0A0J1BBS4_RHOIS|nr:DUF4129 domain-containing protein [Rhodopirellula islandica]KLU04100.1 putative signal peptide and transmembrane protein [Rhodopirellula islandica]